MYNACRRVLKAAAETFVLDRYEIDKLSSMQRLDLNLEKGRMRDDMQV